MDASKLQHQANHNRLAWENCCAHQVINSMFDQVAGLDPESLSHRSDRDEILRFSKALLESEFIFGSPDDEVLESVERKLSIVREKLSIQGRD